MSDSALKLHHHLRPTLGEKKVGGLLSQLISG